MASGSTLGVGISALLAFQRAMATTGHNIANVNTDGYSRQRVDLATHEPQFSGSGYIGTGVNVTNVRRVYDGFLATQVRIGTSVHSQLAQFHRLASQVDNLLADPQAGLTPGLQAFFSAVQGVANDPTSGPARQVLLSEGQSLVDRFRHISGRISGLEAAINTELRNSVSEINGLAQAIADLNRAIIVAKGNANGILPNDLLDQRDLLVKQLAEHVSVTTVEQGDGALNVFVGNGQTMVVGVNAQKMAIVNNAYDPTRLEVGYVNAGSTIQISDQLSGGRIGGALTFRRDTLDPAGNALGRIAIGLGQNFNDQHRLGLDLKGNLGGDFFNVPSAVVNASVNNTGAGTVTAAIIDTSQLTTSDYLVRFDGGGLWSVIRLSDNTTQTGAGPFSVDGLTIAVGGAPAVGDTFLVQPTASGAETLSVSINDTNEIAVAAPIRTEVSIANQGSAQISAGTVNTPPPPDLNLQQTVTITFNNPPTDFDVNGVGTGNPTGVPYVDGSSITFNGWTVQITGLPAAGDTFTISANTNGVSDNRNALLLADLQTQATLAGNSVTYEGALGQLVADVGSQTHLADVNREAQSVLLNQAIAAHEGVSGVNLDEEAANLLQFQQAYQAAAQMIAVADLIFQSLISALRR